MRYTDEIDHRSHPHNLKPEDSKVLFRCNGCKEDGIGLCYRCDQCKFDLHFHCAITSERMSHPCYPNCSFQFKSKPPKGKLRQCNACGKDVNGFFYRCQEKKGVYLHPCCAKLPKHLDGGEVKLSLWMAVSTPCHKCEKKRNSWIYRSSCKGYTLHVACWREMLVESWWKGRGGTTSGVPTGVPCLKDRPQTPHKMSKSKSKKKKWCEMLRLALQFLISAVLGDPTTFIAGVFVSLMSRA
ncbi:uncharacterized protein LOC120287616 [Eucalyptus grandis]|uniref:uncharacterized protein LOC120287616 n=1 Tax=Eucalyptus grandis TaxID=71139 RepID=UPI00192EE15B|nr:uncharacterized protein LOC120287616 [Eucalyptus grandis]